VLIDRVNEMNNNWWCENIRATNPCGEQPLRLTAPACSLREPHELRARSLHGGRALRLGRVSQVVRVFTRMLDNVVEVTGWPLEKQREEILRKRRHGMGFLGLGSTITMLRMKYGSRDAVASPSACRGNLRSPAGKPDSISQGRRARRRSCSRSSSDARDVAQASGDEARRGPAGQKLPGRILHARYSRYMQRVAEAAPELVNKLAETVLASRITARSRRRARSRCRLRITRRMASSPPSRTTISAT